MAANSAAPTANQPRQRQIAPHAGQRDHEHAGKAYDDRSPAVQPGVLAQHEGGKDRREHRHGKADGRHLRERQPFERQEEAHHADHADRRAARMPAQPARREAGEAGADHRPRNDDGQGEKLAVEQRFHHMRAPVARQLDQREHRRRQQHGEQPQADGEEGAVGPRGRSGGTVHMFRLVFLQCSATPAALNSSPPSATGVQSRGSVTPRWPIYFPARSA